MKTAAAALTARPERSFVAYVGPFRFPWGQPGSRRVYGIARSLMAVGRRVVVVNGDAEPDSPRLLERDGEGELLHVGVSDAPQPGDSVVAKALRLFVAHGDRTVRWLEAQAVRPSHVIVYGGYAPFMARVMRWCKKHRIPVLVDVVEWYDGGHQAGGRIGPYHLSTEYALRNQYHRCSGVIAISSYLEAYYRGRGTKVIRVPPTLDVMSLSVGGPPASQGPLRLVYAGSPGKKDLLANVVRAISSLDQTGGTVQLEVLGPSEEEVERLLGAAGTIPPAVHVRGRVSQQSVSDAVQRADFSVLLREPLRFAQAGFPTKVPESLAVGTPVMCNATSDIGSYVRDGVEGLISTEQSVDAFANVLTRALALSPDQRAAMRVAAREAAEGSFDYRVYSKALDAFLEEVRA